MAKKRNKEYGRSKKKKIKVLSEQNKPNYTPKGKKSKGSKTFEGERITHARQKSLEEMFLADYARAITSRNKRPFTLKAFAKGYDEERLKEYEYELKKARYLSNPKNRSKLLEICNQNLTNIYGPDAVTNYGIPGSFRQADIPQDKPSREPETHVFTYSDEMREAFIRARKLPIGDWERDNKTKGVQIKTRKYLFNVDGQILLGEITIETTKDNYIEKNARSGVKFSIYYRGQEDAKFIVCRWDYEPLSLHINKFDREGYFQIDGVRLKNVMHSHVHKYTLHDRLVLTQNQSPDIGPTPLNEHTKEGESEKRYGSFGAMVTDFESTFNLGAIPLPEREIQKTPLRKLGRKYCPEYSTELREEIPPMEDYELSMMGAFAPDTKLLGNGQIAMDIDAMIAKGFTIQDEPSPAQPTTPKPASDKKIKTQEDGGQQQ